MTTKRRPVIRSYELALAILRDHGGLLVEAVADKDDWLTGERVEDDCFVAKSVTAKLLADKLIERSRRGYVYAAAKRESDLAAGRQRRENARVKQIAKAFAEADGSILDAKQQIVAILRDIEANGI
jgi:hypothetical protein